LAGPNDLLPLDLLLLRLQAANMSFALDFLLFATGWGHVFLAPYTKVEESFNLHAVHDVLSYGVSTDAIRNVRNPPELCSALEFP
jgi:hypothetical protein